MRDCLFVRERGREGGREGWRERGSKIDNPTPHAYNPPFPLNTIISSYHPLPTSLNCLLLLLQEIAVAVAVWVVLVGMGYKYN